MELDTVCVPLGMRPRSAAAVLLMFDVTVICHRPGRCENSSMPLPVRNQLGLHRAVAEVVDLVDHVADGVAAHQADVELISARRR